MANLADYRALLGVKEDSSSETIQAAFESRVADLERSPLPAEEKAKAMRLLEDALFVLQEGVRQGAYDDDLFFGRPPDGDALSLPYAAAPWGVPVVYVWGAVIVLSLLIRLVLRESAVATYLLANALSFGSIFIVNSFIVARRVGDVTTIRYPMRDPAHADKWRYKFMKGITGPAAGMILLNLGVILVGGAFGHWKLLGSPRHFVATAACAVMALFVVGTSIAGLVWGVGPDD